MSNNTAKVKNNAVEFWRIVFTLGVSFFHFNLFTRTINMGQPPIKDGILLGGWVLGYFLFLTGYFMMASYMRKEQKGLINHTEAYKPAWGYFWSRYKGLMPAFVTGTLFVFISRNIAVKTPISQWPVLFFRSIFEFLGLQQIGMIGNSEAVNNAGLAAQLAATADKAGAGMMVGPEAEAVATWPTGFTAGLQASNVCLWNGPGWYISCIIVVSVILYWILCKNKDFFIGLFCPFIIVSTYGYYGLECGEVWDRSLSGLFYLPSNIVRVAAGLCLGCLMYFLVEWIKEKRVAEKYKIFWNLLSIGLTVFILYFMWVGTEWNEVQNNAALLPLTVVILVGQDAISKFLSGPLSKFSAFVGKLSLYWYITHWGWVLALPAMFPKMGYLPMAATYIGLCFVTAVVMMLLCEKVINPCINRIQTKLNAE